MCGRFTLTTTDLQGLVRDLGAELDPAFRRPWRPRFNVAPGDAHVIVRIEAGGRRVKEARFGLETAPGQRQINARAETAALKPTFREAWRDGRCAVPADGFFEWEGPKGARRPVWLHRPDGRPLLFAALLRQSAGGGLPEFAIVTVEANADVRAIHDRMPAVLAEGKLDEWLEGAGAPRLAPEGTLAARRVSSRINSVANDDPDCLAEPERDPQLKLI
jgi:putative SOS response-associated peptidase YedK